VGLGQVLRTLFFPGFFFVRSTRLLRILDSCVLLAIVRSTVSGTGVRTALAIQLSITRRRRCGELLARSHKSILVVTRKW
jgi:hypothetical protein